MADSNKPELISFDLCPFVQRSVITLLEKNVEFDLTYIDLANKPDWFLEISPLGKVPVLREKGQVLFESAVINEYLDEVNPPSLHPADPFKKAQNRAWVEVGGNQLMHSFRMMMAETREDYETHRDALIKGFRMVENQVGGTFFNGEHFSLVDTAWAPVFTRLLIIEEVLGEDYLPSYPKIRAWANALVARDSVINSVREGFREKFLTYLQNKTYHDNTPGYVADRLAGAA
ncbi:glutathione S-transferase family protein [Thalassospira mesophila]|uniref:glutathione S-transferase family protein n=1 Tax=Thalassospira mesophila TaxID=1293891 RepID=UPI000A1E6CC2|nr:glutathione S-transferase family protein [Thalassospira mesophila]